MNYADDLVICCRGNAEQATDAMRSIFRKLKLTVNEEKTHVCQVPRESFDFLGYTFGRCYSKRREARTWANVHRRERSGGLSPNQRSDRPKVELAGY